VTRFKAVFLDAYGTLLEAGDIEAVYQRILVEHGHPAGRAQVAEWMAAARGAVRHLPEPVHDDWSVDAGLASARREAQASAFLESAGLSQGCVRCADAIRGSWIGDKVFRLYPEVPATLAALTRTGVLIGAVSNWEPRLPELLASLGIAGCFDFILTSEAAGYAKPSPRLFEVALAQVGVGPGEAVHAGDQLVEDVRGAASAGIAAVLVRRSGEGPAPHSPCISTLTELLPLVESRGWLSGRVISGKGEAAGFTQQDWVRSQVTARLGFACYPGTLNLRLEAAGDRLLWAAVRETPGVPIEPEPGHCAARCYPVSIEGRFAGAIVLPLVPGYPEDVIEVISSFGLRDALPAVDGSIVTVALALG